MSNFTADVHDFENFYPFWSELYRKTPDSKHDVTAERWAGRIRERVYSGRLEDIDNIYFYA